MRRIIMATTVLAAIAGTAFAGQVIVGGKEFKLNIPFCGS